MAEGCTPPRGGNPQVIYTVGTSTRGFEQFMKLLDFYAISHVVDVRRFPKSRLDHFEGERLASALRRRGVQYFYLGKELGGYRKGGYEAYMDSHAFRRGIEALMSVALRGASVVVCAERLPWRCHRRFIGEALEGKGWHVVHLIEKGRIWRREQGVRL